MGYPDLDRARALHAALHTVFYRDGEWTDCALLTQVLTLCREAAAAVSDSYCREELDLVGGYATELFSESGHGKYESDSLSGSEFLRRQALKALDSFHSRLYSLEAARSAPPAQRDRR